MPAKTKKIFAVETPTRTLVSLTESRYEEHITSYHPEMEGKEQVIKKAFIDPNTIYCSNTYEDSDVYELEHDDQELKEIGKYVRAVVLVSGFEGNVRSAFTTDQKYSGKVKWKK